MDCIGLDWIGLVLVLGGLDWIGLVLVLGASASVGAGASVGASASVDEKIKPILSHGRLSSLVA